MTIQEALQILHIYRHDMLGYVRNLSIPSPSKAEVAEALKVIGNALGYDIDQPLM